MYSRAKRHAYQIVNDSDEGGRAGRVFNLAVIAIIGLTALAIMLETIEPMADVGRGAFTAFEIVSVAIFTVEYLVRVWSCTEDPAYSHPLWGRLRFAVQPLAVADLLAIVPFYVPLIVGLDLRFVRVLRLLRLLKIARYSESMSLVGHVLRSRRDVLISTVFVGFILLFFASALMYLVERETQPEGFSSIPAAMWWGVVTLTTVGYGDLYPVTPLGRGLGTFVALLGIGLFAMPAGILGSAFVDELEQRKSARSEIATCPHCGKPLQDHASPDA